MKKVFPYLAFILIAVACNSNSSLTVDNYEAPQTHQELKKNYGAGGKIIYGTSEGSQNETPSPTYSSEENYHLHTNTDEIIVHNNKKENNQVKTSKKKGFGFSALKIRPFSKKVKKSKTSQSEGDNTAFSQIELGVNAGFVSTTFIYPYNDNIVSNSWSIGGSFRFPTGPKWGLRLEANYHDRGFKKTTPYEYTASIGFLDLDAIMDYRAFNRFGFHFGSYMGIFLFDNYEGNTDPSFNVPTNFELGLLGGISYTVLKDKLTFETRAQIGGMIYGNTYSTFKFIARYNFPLVKKKQ